MTDVIAIFDNGTLSLIRSFSDRLTKRIVDYAHKMNASVKVAYMWGNLWGDDMITATEFLRGLLNE